MAWLTGCSIQNAQDDYGWPCLALHDALAFGPGCPSDRATRYLATVQEFPSTVGLTANPSVDLTLEPLICAL